MSGASCSCFCYRGNSHSIENYGPKNSHATCANFLASTTRYYLQLYHSVQGTKVPHADRDNHCTPALAGLGFSAPRTP